jgi:hypothetical protein
MSLYSLCGLHFTGISHARGVPSVCQLAGSREANRKASGTRLDIEENEIHCKTFSLQRYFAAFHSFNDLIF